MVAGLNTCLSQVLCITHVAAGGEAAAGGEGVVVRVKPRDGGGPTLWCTLQSCRLSLSHHHVLRGGDEVGSGEREGGWGGRGRGRGRGREGGIESQNRITADILLSRYQLCLW